MQYEIKPLSTFVVHTDRAPLSKKEYQALSHPDDPVPQSSRPDKVDISSQEARQAVVDALRGDSGSNSSSLISSLTPASSTPGYSAGLYAGVGQISLGQLSALISRYI